MSVLQKQGVIAFTITFTAAFCLAAAMRIPQLELHRGGDEANQAMKTGILLEKGEYAYDPYEHHGPTLYYLTLPVMWVSGVSSFAESSITDYRIVTVIFGLLTILLLWPMREALGNWAVFWSALILAVSHVMTYYSRYYIQEILFVCFIQATIASGWRLYNKPSIVWAILFGVSLGLVHATKETALLVAFSMAASILLVLGYSRIRDKAAVKEQLNGLFVRKTALYILVAMAAALLISIVLFSSFFTHWRGPLDSLLTHPHLTRPRRRAPPCMTSGLLLSGTIGIHPIGKRDPLDGSIYICCWRLLSGQHSVHITEKKSKPAQQFNVFCLCAVLILHFTPAVPYKLHGTCWFLSCRRAARRYRCMRY